MKQVKPAMNEKNAFTRQRQGCAYPGPFTNLPGVAPV